MANNFWNIPHGDRPSLRSIWEGITRSRKSDRFNTSDSPDEFIRRARAAGYFVVPIGNPNSEEYQRADDVEWLREHGYEDYAYREHFYVFADENVAFSFKVRWG